ncbi:MAG: aspartate/glutamate racemase family protein [Pseudonocardiaceae bacterium]
MATLNCPQEVARNLEFFDREHLWRIVSRNPPVQSCADAAQRRNRLGHVGIPLCDELKSSVGVYDSAGRSSFVVAHCRGHQNLDTSKLHGILGSTFERVDGDKLESELGLSYGLVTPFYFAAHPHVRQIVDETVLEPYLPPHTMMTNLGHLEYAVEFRPSDIFGALPNVEVANIVEGRDRRATPGETIGILTGNSPESGMMLWQGINNYIRTSSVINFRGDISFPRVIVESVPEMGLSMELAQRETQVKPVVLDAVRKLCDSGANVVAIACNTTQYYSSEVETICRGYGARFVSIVDETARYLKNADIRTFDFLAIGAVSDFATWSDFRRIVTQFDVYVPSERNITAITNLAFSVKKEVVSSTTINQLRDLVNNATKTDTVVFALTELSILFASQRSKQKSQKRFIDTLDILAQAIAKIYLDGRAAVGAS